MKHMEIEYKWDANAPRAFARAHQALTHLCGPLTPHLLHIRDTYLDDAKESLAKELIALRVRNTDGKWEATFKTRTQIKNGKAVRREETLALPNVKNFSQALRTLAQKKSWKGIRTASLAPRFALANKRSVYEFTYQGTRLEMVFDKVTMYVMGRRVHMQEIELELKRGNSKVLDQFATLFMQQTKLARTQISKVKTAELLRKLWKK